MAEPVEVISTTLAPAFVLTGAAVFLNFVQARLFRVTDRARRVVSGEGPKAHRETLLRRGRVLRNALLLGVLSIMLTLTTTLFLLGRVLLGAHGLDTAAVFAFAGAMVALAASALLALFDAVTSVATVERQLKG